jgi:hypothetical protein
MSKHLTRYVELCMVMVVCWFEILRGFIRLQGLYGLKYDGLITPVIAIVLVPI